MSQPARREALAVAGILALAFSLRVAFVLAGEANPHHHDPILDSRLHVEWARALAAGETYAPFEGQPFFRAPLYVFFLAALFSVFGDGLLAPRLVQCALGTGSVGLVYLVGKRAFDSRSGLVAATIAATYWVLIYFDGELLIPTLIVFLDLLALWLTLGVDAERRPLRAAPAGFVWGLSAIARPNVLLFMPLLAAWLAFGRGPDRRRSLAAAGVFSAALLAPILPITVYNATQGDRVLISSQGGVNLWIGNNPETGGVVAIVPGTRAGWWEGHQDAIARAEQAEGRSLRPSEVSQHYARRAVSFILTQPDRSIPLIIEKLRLFWTAWEYSNNEDIHFFAHRYSAIAKLSIGFGALAPLGLLGFGLCVRDRRFFPLTGFLVVYSLSVIAFFVTSRFRVPVLPVLMVFAGHSVVWMFDRGRQRRVAPLVAALGFTIVFGIWTTQQAPVTGIGSNGHVQLGRAEARRGQLDAARRELRHALMLEPNHINGLVDLAEVERLSGRPAEALLLFRRATQLAPLRTDAIEGLLDTLIEEERLAEAETWAREYLLLLQRRGVPAPEIPFYHLGRILEARGDSRGATAAYREAIRRDRRSQRAVRALAALERGASADAP